MFGNVLINDDAPRTLTPGIMIFKGSHQTDWGALTAASVLAVVPAGIGFLYLQRFLFGGLAAERSRVSWGMDPAEMPRPGPMPDWVIRVRQ